MSMSQKYFNQKAPVWDETIAEKDAAKLHSLACHLDIEPGSRVLDVGTGTGVFTPYLLALIGPSGKLTCLDYAEDMINIAKKKFTSGNIDFVHADIEYSGLAGGAYDAVVCYSSFPHFENKDRSLAEIYRILTNRGRLYILHSSSRAKINEIHKNIPDVCNHLIPAQGEMKKLLSEAGYEEIEIIDDSEKYIVKAGKLLR